MMLCKQSFDPRFVGKIRDLEEKYGQQMLNVEGIGPENLDINRFSEDFFKNTVLADVSIDGNANCSDTSVVSFDIEFIKSLQKLNSYYVIWKRLTEKFNVRHANRAIDLIVRGNLKLHDAHGIYKAYCYAFSLFNLVHDGMPFITKPRIKKPRRFKSFINLTIQFVAYASNQLMGAIALPDLFVFMDWYLRKDYGEEYLKNEDVRAIIKEELQSLVYSFNFPWRSTQSAFVNVSTFDKHFLNDLFSDLNYPDFSNPNLDSIIKLQEFYMRWFVDETKLQTLTFPVNTVTFYKDEENQIKDLEFLDLVSELNCINGCFNIYTGPLGSLSSCCRLRNSVDKTNEYTNSFGSGGISIGSHRVVTLNIPRLALESQDLDDFNKRVDENTSYAQDILDCHKDLLEELIVSKRLPLYTYGFMDLKKQFSTIGFLGLNEAVEILGHNILEDDGLQLAQNTLARINRLNEKRTKIDNRIRNLEQIPGESAAITLAKKDKLLYSASPYDIYSNQYVPLWKEADLNDRIRLAGKIDTACSGGAILHINVLESITEEQMKKLIISTAEQGVIYFAINVAQCRCVLCSQLHIGKFDKSPCCNAEVEKYLRVVGFLTSVDSWHARRRLEYTQRQFYSTDVF